jgi:hypothetical protein
MGFFSNIANRVRTSLRGDKDQAVTQLRQGGGPAAGNATSGYNLLQSYGYDALGDHLRLEHDLLSRFIDYEEMDDYPEISSALDIFADDASQPETQLNRTVWVTSPDKQVEKILNDLFVKRLRMDEEIWEIVRTVCKYGNDYEELLVTEEGVVGMVFLPPPTVRRLEGGRGELYGFVQDVTGRFRYSPAEFQAALMARAGGGSTEDGGAAGEEMPGGVDGPKISSSTGNIIALEDWEVVHFRMRGKQRRSVYGYSVMESARWIWKRLMLLEDAALIYRLQRAPERFAFYVDVGDLPPAEALAYVNRVRQQHRKTKFFNPQSGKLDLKHNPVSQDEDFFVPVRKGVESTRIEVIGSPAWQHMDDVEYFRDKLFAAIKIPKAYLAQDDNTARAVLSSEDVRFARSILRVQREIRNGLAKVCRVHLAAIGVDPKRVEYEVHMTVPSAIFELAQLEVRNARADLASRMREHVSLAWVLKEVYSYSDPEIETIIKQRDEDIIREGQAQMKGQGGGGGGFESKSRSVRSGISDQQLFAGNREGEKRANGKLNKLLANDRHTAKRINELGGLLRELKYSTTPPPPRRK